ncbi:MAG TPA: hypothetical protein VNF68_07955 [Candidatus Baltobacteraceae bacterium]|nr:hypothetical protein [Candidatus Baltobacteraceae bacterium]
MGSSRFPALLTISTTLRIVGWLVVVASVILFLDGLAALTQFYSQVSQYGTQTPFGSAEGVLKVGPGIVGIVSGLCTAAFGELIRVFVAIEENTRVAAGQSDPIADAGDVGGQMPTRELDEFLGRHVKVRLKNGANFLGILRQTGDARIYQIVDGAGKINTIWSYMVNSIELASENSAS